MQQVEAWDWDLVMEKWDDDMTTGLIGFPYFFPAEVELRILLHVPIDDTFVLEMVCRYWFCLLRGREFRELKLATVCQQRIDCFPRYKLIPGFLDGKGWRYLIASKRAVVAGQEDKSLMLATVSYDDGSTVYEGFWCEDNASKRADSSLLALAVHSAIPNGFGVLYHKFAEETPSISIEDGVWCQGVLSRGVVRKDDKILFVIKKYAGGGAFDGCFYCPGGEKFQGLFFLKFPITIALETLSQLAMFAPHRYLQACLGQYYEADGTKGQFVNRSNPRLKEAFARRKALDDAQRTVNAIPDKDERIAARRAHEKRLVRMQKERIEKER